MERGRRDNSEKDNSWGVDDGGCCTDDGSGCGCCTDEGSGCCVNDGGWAADDISYADGGDQGVDGDRCDEDTACARGW